MGASACWKYGSLYGKALSVGYLIFAVVMAATIIGILSLRHRGSNNPAKSVDSFQRAIKALTPERKGKDTNL